MIKIRKTLIETLKILGLVTIHRVSILQNHNYRMWGTRPCFDESGLYILIALAVATFIILSQKKQINNKIIFALSITALAINLGSIIFTDSFNWLTSWEEWRMGLNISLVSLSLIGVAWLFFKLDQKKDLNRYKLTIVGSTILIISYLTPNILTLTKAAIINLISLLTLPILVALIVIGYLMKGEVNKKIFYEIAFLFLASSIYITSVGFCKFIN